MPTVREEAPLVDHPHATASFRVHRALRLLYLRRVGLVGGVPSLLALLAARGNQRPREDVRRVRGAAGSLHVLRDELLLSLFFN
jgi:hypothetical protein